MEEGYHSDYGISYEKVYSELKRIQAENYHLKKQLKNQRNLGKGKDRYIKKLEKRLEDLDKKDQHYRNGRKRGQYGFHG